MASSSTSPSTTSSSMDSPVDISKVYEFWLRPENYSDVPLPMAFELLKANMIDITRFCYHIRECRDIPDNLEEMCEYAVRTTHFPTRVQRKEWINWSHFLEENVLSQTSQEFEEQEKKHEKNLEKYKELLLEMDMRSGGTQRIMLFFDTQQEMMSVDPLKALAMVAPAEWTSYVGFSEQDRQEYRRRFTVEMSNLHYRHDVPLRRARSLAAIKADREIRKVASKRKSHEKYNKKRAQLRAEREAGKKTEEPEKKAVALKKIKKLNEIHQISNERIMEILRLSAPDGPSK